MENGMWVFAWFVLAVLCDVAYYVTRIAQNGKAVSGYAFLACVFFGMAILQQFGWLV